MTGQDLKNSILQLAIQGKLVAQDANDEPASVLLERIKAEKKKLIEEKKIKKEKPLAEITEDEKPFEIPDSWVWVRLGDCVWSINDGDHMPPPQKPNGIPFVTISCLKDNNIDFSIAKSVDKDYYAHLQWNRKPTKGDIIFPVTCSYGMAVKIKESKDFCFQRHIAIVKCSSYSDYIYHYLSSSFVLDQCDRIATGIAQKTVPIKGLREFLIPLPPHSEQKRIVAKIEELMPLVDEYDKAQKELDALNSAMPEQLKQSILQEAIMGKLGTNNPDDEPASELLKRIRKEKEQLIKDKKIKKEKPLPEITDEEKPFDIPDNWVWVRLNEVFNIVSARRVHQKDWKSSGIPFYRTREIGWLSENRNTETELFIDESLYKKLTQTNCPSENDIMMTAVGTIGKTYIVKKEDKFYYKDASVLCLENFCNVDPHYFCYLFDSYYFKNMAADGAMGTTVSTITIVRANSYIIPLPPLAEQKRIVSKIENLFACIEPLAKDLK